MAIIHTIVILEVGEYNDPITKDWGQRNKVKWLGMVRDILVLILILYLAEVLGMMAGALSYEILPDGSFSSYIYMVLSTGVYILSAYLAVRFYGARVLHMKEREYGLTVSWKNAAAGAGSALALTGISVLLTVFIFKGSWQIAPKEEWSLRVFRALMDFGIGAGIVEEMIFRGVLLKNAEERLGQLRAVGVTSAIFAFLHVTAVTGVADFIWRFLYSFILAVLLCRFKYQTGDLSASMAFHGVWNFIFMGILSLGTEESLTALVSYVAESQAYLVIPLMLCVGLWALLFWRRMLSLKRE